MPRIGGCECEGLVGIEDGGLVDSSECWPEVAWLSNEFRLTLPCDGIANDCPVANREGRIMKLPIGDDMPEGDGDDDWLSFFLKNLPKIFFVPLVGVASISGRIMLDGDSDRLSPEERE
jgi:hypothetical protein